MESASVVAVRRSDVDTLRAEELENGDEEKRSREEHWSKE
jgi:hypothetical protein